LFLIFNLLGHIDLYDCITSEGRVSIAEYEASRRK